MLIRLLDWLVHIPGGVVAPACQSYGKPAVRVSMIRHQHAHVTCVKILAGGCVELLADISFQHFWQRIRDNHGSSSVTREKENESCSHTIRRVNVLCITLRRRF